MLVTVRQKEGQTKTCFFANHDPTLGLCAGAFKVVGHVGSHYNTRGVGLGSVKRFLI